MHHDVLFVYGALRSGTTVLRLMLDCHPDLSCSGEHDFLFDTLVETDGTYTYDRDALQASRIYRTSGISISEQLDGLDALEDMIAQLQRLRPGRQVLMIHRNIAKAAALFPGRPILHVLRDPRDVARSSIGMGWAGNVYCGLDNWLNTEAEWGELAPSVADTALHRSYETLVTEPERSLMDICDHFGVAYDPAMLGFHATTSYSPIDAGLANQWRHKLSETEIRQVEARAGAMLQNRGYAPSGLPKLNISPVQDRLLRAESRMKRVFHASRKYGWPLVLQRGIARAVNLSEMRRRTQLKIDDIDLQRLK